MCVHEIWTQDSKRKSGAKIGYGVSGGTMDEYAKSQFIYEQMEFVKKLFLREIKKYFPLMVYGREKNILGINIFETNIKWILDWSHQFTLHWDWTKCMDSICPLSNAYIYQLQQYGGVIHPRQI